MASWRVTGVILCHCLEYVSFLFRCAIATLVLRTQRSCSPPRCLRVSLQMLQRGITAFVCVAGSSRAESLRFAKSLMPTEAKWLPKGKAESTLGRLDEGEAPRGVGSAARIVLNPMGAGKVSGLTYTAAGETRCFLLEKAHLVLFAVVRQPHFPNSSHGTR